MRRMMVFLLVALFFAQASRAQNITTVVGGGPNNVPASSANFARPRGMIRDSSGSLYFVADSSNRVFKIDPAGLLTVVAGNGTNGFSGDGGPALAATLSSPRPIAVDNQGNVFVGDTNNHVVRRIDAVTGIITTYAGGGTAYVDGQPATSVSLSLPYGLTADSNGNVYVADAGFARVRRIDANTHIITTVGGPIGNPGAMAFDSQGNLFVADVNGSILRIDAITGIQTVFLGSLNSPAGLAFDGAGNLYFSEENLHRVRRRDASTGTLTVVAGGLGGFAGDGGPATSARMAFPAGISLDAAGNLTISDSGNNRLRYVAAATGIISTFAGNGSHSAGGNGFLATNAGSAPQGLAIDANGRLLLGDFGQVRRVDAISSIITAIAGSYLVGFSGDGGLATNATLLNPAGIAFDSQNNLYIMDVNNSRVRRVDATTGIITSVAGNGSFDFGGDGGPALSASLRNGRGVIVDNAGNIIIADFGNLRVRRVDAATGFITTMVGTGAFCNAGPCGDGGPAAAAPIFPFGFAFDLSGNLLISDQGTGRIRKVDKTTGIITSVAGTTRGFSGDGGPANAAQMDSPSGIALDASGNLYIADQRNNRVRKVDSSTGIISTIGGTGTFGFSGDGGLAVNARLAFPTWVALDAQGGVLFSDQNNFRVRRIEPAPSDSAAPVINCIVPNQSAWYGADVTVSCTAEDTGSGLAHAGDASFSLTTSVAFGEETASAQTDTRSVCDNAGNCATAGPYTFKVDKKAPQQSTCDSADGAWHGSDVTLHCTYTDGGSGPANQQVALSTSVAGGTETANAAASAGGAQACDALGNCASSPADIPGNKVDKLAPSVTCGAADGVWHASNVSINCTAADGGSGPASQNVALTTSVAAGTENANASTNSAQLCDAVNSCSTAGPVGGNMIDRKAPSISISSPAATSYLLNQSAASSYGCSDGGSGAASCSGPVASGSNFDTASVGAKSFTVTATDNVGNSTSSTVSYAVTYASSGMCGGSAGHSILQPINGDGSSVFKQGSTVPAKFRVCDANGNSVGAAGVVASFNLVQTMSGTVVSTINEPVDSTTPDANFRWDSSAMQWIFNINTKLLSKNVTYFFRVTLNDGSTITFNFGLK